MSRKPLALLVGASLLCFTAPAHAENASASAAAMDNHAEKEMTEGEKLKKLFADSDEDNLRRNPIGAIFRGDMRYADQIGDFITDEYNAGEKAANEAELAALMKIDRSKLSATDKIAYDVFKRNKKQAILGFL